MISNVIPNDRFVDFHFGKSLSYESLLHALTKAGSRTGYRTGIEEILTYRAMDITLTGATLKKSLVSMPLRLRIYGHGSQSKIGVYFDEPNLYYRFFPMKCMGRGLEEYARALKGIIDKLPGMETLSKNPDQPEPPEEPLDAVGVRVPNKPKKPLVEKVAVTVR